MTQEARLRGWGWYKAEGSSSGGGTLDIYSIVDTILECNFYGMQAFGFKGVCAVCARSKVIFIFLIFIHGLGQHNPHELWQAIGKSCTFTLHTYTLLRTLHYLECFWCSHRPASAAYIVAGQPIAVVCW